MSDALRTFNALPAAAAHGLVTEWLACGWWVEQVVQHRPYQSEAHLTEAATEFWRQTTPTQQRQAFAAHPLIGDVDTLRQKFDGSADRGRATLAHREQGQVLNAAEAVLDKLAAANRAYHDRHGFIFIICASGLSAEAMLAALHDRLPNETAVELQNAAVEQERIMRLRMAAALPQLSHDS